MKFECVCGGVWVWGRTPNANNSDRTQSSVVIIDLKEFHFYNPRVVVVVVCRPGVHHYVSAIAAAAAAVAMATMSAAGTVAVSGTAAAAAAAAAAALAASVLFSSLEYFQSLRHIGQELLVCNHCCKHLK